MIHQIIVPTGRRGLHEITHPVQKQLTEYCQKGGPDSGLSTLFIPHTSASLLIQENADMNARQDLENWLNRLVPEGDPLYTHIQEGPDDMPSHIKSMLTATSIAIPFAQGKLMLGTWQGIFLWEHRRGIGQRQLIMHTGS